MTSRLPWADLQEIISRADAPRLVRLDGQPVVQLAYDPLRHELAVRLPRGADAPPESPLTLLRVQQRVIDAGEIIEISTTSTQLFPYFHGFAVAVADRVQLDGLDSHTAVAECLARWRDLFREVSKLTPEQQLGLFGELWLLRRLITQHGADTALDAWTGPAGQAHDFRLGTTEIEVKSTSGEHRIHVISSDTQLTASEGAELFVLSLQFTSAGANEGASLSSQISDVRSQLAGSAALGRFDQLLDRHFGLTPDALAPYTERLKLRTRPSLVPVDTSFPRIDLRWLADLTDVARISDVRYRVKLDGLGHEAGSVVFIAHLGEDPE